MSLVLTRSPRCDPSLLPYGSSRRPPNPQRRSPDSDILGQARSNDAGFVDAFCKGCGTSAGLTARYRHRVSMGRRQARAVTRLAAELVRLKVDVILAGSTR